MNLIEPKIIAPDSSHWAKWADATLAKDSRQQARMFHACLMEQGRIPLLSFHHLEELLGVEDNNTVRARVAFLQALPMLAYFRLPKDEVGLGSIVEVLAAEAIAASEGHDNLISIRDRARELLLKTGTGTQAIGEEAWVWEVVWSFRQARKNKADRIAALGPLRLFDENQTIGELAKSKLNTFDQRPAGLKQIHAQALQEAMQSTGGNTARARSIADDFLAEVAAMMSSPLLPGTTTRELLVSLFVSRGLDEEEVRDECVFADLCQLAQFRTQLRIAASKTGKSFEALKRIPMDILPSRMIGEALRTHGQRRQCRPGSDLNDFYLSAFAAYCDILYVDKRTAEDFRRAQHKEPWLGGLIGEITKAPDFESFYADALKAR